MSAGGATGCETEHYTAQYQGLRKRQHRTEHRPTPSPRIEIKIPGTSGNRTSAAGLEDRDSPIMPQ